MFRRGSLNTSTRSPWATCVADQAVKVGFFTQTRSVRQTSSSNAVTGWKSWECSQPEQSKNLDRLAKTLRKQDARYLQCGLE